MCNRLVSVIIPMYNAENCITRCIESIERQTYDKIEIILVDNGSLDKSCEIAKLLMQKYSNIYMYSCEMRGAANARSVGLEYSKGEFICFVDSDDFVHELYVEKLVNSIEQTGALLSVCGINRVNNSGKIEGKISTSVISHNKDCFLIKDVLEGLYSIGLLNSPWCKLFRKKYIANTFRGEMLSGEDLVFVLDYIIGGYRYNKQISFVHDELYNYVSADNYDRNKVIFYLNRKTADCCIMYKRLIECGKILGCNNDSMRRLNIQIGKRIVSCITEIGRTDLKRNEFLPFIKSFVKNKDIKTLSHNVTKHEPIYFCLSIMIQLGWFNFLSYLVMLYQFCSRSKG